MLDDVPPLSPDDPDPEEIEAAWAAVSAKMRSESYEDLLLEVKRRALEGDVRWQMYLLQVDDPDRYGEPGEGIDFGPIPVPERQESPPSAEEPRQIVEAAPPEPAPKRHLRQALILLATREPDLPLSELERRVGCSRGYASRIPEIKRLRQLARDRGISARPRGYRRDDGDVEAVGE
jgi:hypothetical protein